MKKTVAFFLLCIFIFNVFGYYFVFKTAQYQIKKEVLSEIKKDANSNQLVSIVISKNKLATVEWLDDHKEIRYQGELYDVVKSRETPTHITFYCINDKKENSLIAALDEHIKNYVTQNQPNPKDSSKKMVDQVIKLYFSTEEFLFNSPVTETSAIFQADFNLLSPIINTTSPPPEFS